MLSTSIAVVTAAGIGGFAVLESRGYATAKDAVRAVCQPVHIVRTVPLGVMWQASGSQPGEGWIASIDHEFGGRYVVKNCRFKSVVHA